MVCTYVKHHCVSYARQRLNPSYNMLSQEDVHAESKMYLGPKVQKVQMVRATKLVSSVKLLPYKDRNKNLNFQRFNLEGTEDI